MANPNPAENPIPYAVGDPDDHEVLNAVLGPHRFLWLPWGISAAAIIGVGAKLIGVGTESFNLSKELWQLGAVAAAGLLAWPAASFWVWAGHYDTDHYDHVPDHIHPEVAVPKAAWNAAAWTGNKLIKAERNLRKSK